VPTNGVTFFQRFRPNSSEGRCPVTGQLRQYGTIGTGWCQGGVRGLFRRRVCRQSGQAAGVRDCRRPQLWRGSGWRAKKSAVTRRVLSRRKGTTPYGCAGKCQAARAGRSMNRGAMRRKCGRNMERGELFKVLPDARGRKWRVFYCLMLYKGR
jgi:hypothetical protein